MKATISNTKHIVPDVRQSGPLTREELTPETPAPVFADGVNLTEAAELYFEALAGCETTGIIPGLAEAVNEASKGMLRRDLRILIDLDTKVHAKKGFKTYEAYYAEQTGRKVSRSTLWRRRLVAEFALLLAAKGRPEIIPSQRQCELLRKSLTRPHAVSLVLQISNPAVLHRMGERKFLDEIERYRTQNHLPNIGECVEETTETCDTDSDLGQEETDPETQFLLKMRELFRMQNAEDIKRPITTAAAIFNALMSLKETSPYHMEISARIADLLLSDPSGPLASLARPCLIHMISAVITSESGRQELCSARAA